MSYKACVLSLLYLVSLARSLLLYPREAAIICEGEPLELTCSTNVTILGWSSPPLMNEQGQAHRFMRFISSIGVSQQVSNMTFNSTLFNVSRVSSQDELPLVSRLVIIPVSKGLNGTKINCTEQRTSNETASTTINVMNVNHKMPNHPKISMSVMQIHEDHLIVLLEWTAEKGVNYDVSIEATAEPMEATVNFVTVSSVQITVSYDTHYNVSVEGTLCGQKNVTRMEIYYGTCGYPFKNSFMSTSIEVVGFTNPALEGTLIMLHCSFGLTLIGPESIRCMKNGRWEPDPRIVTCNETLSTISSQDYEMYTFDKDSSTQRDDSVSEILIGTLIGLGSLAVFIVITITIVSTVLKRKKKKLIARTVSRYTHDDQKGAEGTLIYADIGPAAFKSMQPSASISLDLDDSHVQYAQINLKMLEQEPSKLPHVAEDNSIDDNLRVNLDNLLIQLRVQVSPFWYQFGEAAGVETEVLDKLADNCSPQECIVEMFDYWLRKQKELPTWSDIAKILNVINLQPLAAQIEMVYTTGKLPIELNAKSLSETSQEMDTKHKASELPPPIPPKMLEVNCSERGFDKSKCMRSYPPLPIAEVVPALPPKTTVVTIPARPPKP